MPRKIFQPVHLPDHQPAKCVHCPLLGLIPDAERERGSKLTHVCLGTMVAIAKRATTLDATSTTRTKPLRRPCDRHWDVWMTLPRHEFSVRVEDIGRYRLPYEATLQRQIDFSGSWRRRN